MRSQALSSPCAAPAPSVLRPRMTPASLAKSFDGSVVAACLAAVVGTMGCGADRPAARPTASEGLVFLVGTPGGGADVARVRVSDAAVEVLAETPDDVEFDPQWVPATLEILYGVRSAGDPKGVPRVKLRDPETGQRRLAVGGPERAEEAPTVSSNGKRVAFVFSAPGRRPHGGVTILQPMTGNNKIAAAAPSGTEFVALSLSPDGTGVAVQAHRNDRGDDILVVLASEKLKPLDSKPQWHDVGPAFDRAGELVFFSRSIFEKRWERMARERSGKSPPMGGGDVCGIHLETDQTHCIDASTDAREFDIAPSPTREEVVFVRERDGEIELFLGRATGEDVHQLTDLPGRALARPRWSPDGERIAFVAGQGGERALVVVDREGRVLLETPGHSPSWAPPFP